MKREKVTKANVSVLSELKDDDEYDFIFLTVRENQLYQALEELKTNNSKCIVTMTNSMDDYNEWENICGEGKILRHFQAQEEGLRMMYWMPRLLRKSSTDYLCRDFRNENG